MNLRDPIKTDEADKTKPADVMAGMFVVTLFLCATTLVIGGTYKVLTLWF